MSSWASGAAQQGSTGGVQGAGLSAISEDTPEGSRLCVFMSAGPADDPGVNSRALAELFQVARERAAEVAYTLSASVLEIYQEQIFDLLTGSKDTGEPRTCGERTVLPCQTVPQNPSMHLAAAHHSCPHIDAAMADPNPGLPPHPAGVSPAGDSLSVKEGPSGLYIPNLRIEAVSGPEDVAAVLQKGRQNRSTFATNMNEHSSRSHLVLSIYVTAKHLAKGK